MVKNFYKFPRVFETQRYTFERQVNGFHVVYKVSTVEDEKVQGFMEVNSLGKLLESSGWQELEFSKVEQEAKRYLKSIDFL